MNYIDYYSIYNRYFKLSRNYGEHSVNCPFHDDKHPSLSVNLDNGLWKCFACGKAGDVYTFLQLFHNISFREAKEKIDNEFQEEKQKYIEKEIVEQYHQNLLRAKDVIEFLQNKRGFSLDTIKKRKLGWDGERITIPIFDEDNRIVNIRRYSQKKSGLSKMLSYREGYGQARLYPVEVLQSDTILVVEGEMDCILANQIGYNAITVTSGAGVWRDEWNIKFVDKNVNIVYDCDKAGREGAVKVANKLVGYAKGIKIIDLGIKEIQGGDITNFFIDLGFKKEDLDKLIEKSEKFTAGSKEQKDTTVYEVHLSQASSSKYNNKYVRMKCLVAGKDLAPYIFPKKVKLHCNMEKDKCESCGLKKYGGERIIEFLQDDREILNLIQVNENIQKVIIKKKAGILQNCNSVNFEITEAMNIEEIMLIPELDFSAEEQEYVVRRSFYLGHGIKTNQSYELTAITIAEPKLQYATHLIFKAVASQDNVSSFQMTPESFEKLKIFQSDDVHKKIFDIAKNLTFNVTKIYSREDLVIAINLVYHSVLSFYFQNKYIHKGWLELLVLGDSRTGKSETAQSLIKFYKIGEFITGENTSYAGLVGGMQQNQKRWSVTWGKIPLNDRRLVFIDECSGLTLETISSMSAMRESGIAEIVKIQTERTNARTRLIWMSNPRGNFTLDSFNFGVKAIPQLIGKPEDIARFDFVISVAKDEVMPEIINTEEIIEYESEYTSELHKNLVLWAWSRKPENIVFTKKAIRMILDFAMQMGKDYTNTIPLVEVANQRIKLARLSVACACMLFSTENGENVIVDEQHVQFIYDFLNHCYKKKSFGYYDFSKQVYNSKKISENNIEDIKYWIEQNEDVVKLFLRYDYLRQNSIMEMCGISKDAVKEIITFLVKNGLIINTGAGYKKEPHFIEYIKKFGAN